MTDDKELLAILKTEMRDSCRTIIACSGVCMYANCSFCPGNPVYNKGIECYKTGWRHLWIRFNKCSVALESAKRWLKENGMDTVENNNG